MRLRCQGRKQHVKTITRELISRVATVMPLMARQARSGLVFSLTQHVHSISRSSSPSPMHFAVNCRMRIVLLVVLLVALVLIACIAWPWLYAAWLWRESTIDFPLLPTSNATDLPVPAIIHQTWRDHSSIPPSWQQASNSCRSLHPGYEYRLWTDADGRRLIENQLPDLLDTYDSYPYDIQRADVIRLVALYLFGGIYLDFDIICLKPLDPLRAYRFVLPKTMPVGLSNDFMVAQPRHPFVLQLLNSLPRSNRNYLTK